MVDRFSSLPNELLDLIFDYTYSSHAPSKPLSKRFLPFYRIHLYRSIHLSSPRHLESLLETIQSRSLLGTLVRSLSLPASKSTDGTNPKLIGNLEKLLPLLPNLDHLDVTKSQPFGAVVRAIDISESLASGLTCLAITTPRKSEEGFFHLQEVYDLLSRLRFLVTLGMFEWEIYDDYHVGPEPGTALPAIKTLRIHGRGAEDDSAAELVLTFPSVADLTLHSTYMDGSNWSLILLILPSTLESLTFLADDDEFRPVDSFSTTLHFQNLKRIHLGRYCFSPSIHRALRSLSLLEEIHLGDGFLDLLGFLSLITGPSRLQHLKRLILDLDYGSFGPCISIEGTEVSPEENEDGATDWDLPYYLEEGGLDRIALVRLVEMAKSSGIRVEGTVLKALKVLELYCMDQNNRAVLAYSGPINLRRLHNKRMEALRYDYQFPELDFDSLERDKLEIVETKMPETGWSVLGFREKDKEK